MTYQRVWILSHRKQEPSKDFKQEDNKIKFMFWKDNADSSVDCISI